MKDAAQLKLGLFDDKEPAVYLERLYSGLLWEALSSAYRCSPDIVFTALAIARYIEAVTKTSIRCFVRTLLPIRSGVISVNGTTMPIKPRLPQHIAALVKPLGKFGGY